MTLPAALLVIAMVMTTPMDFRRRGLIRTTLPEITSGVVISGHPVRMVVRFAIGRPPALMSPSLKPRLRRQVADEQNWYGDLALLNMTDGTCNDGKTWYTFEWAIRNFPEAAMIFKLDDDTVVDWRLALPRTLRSVAPGDERRPAQLPLRRLYVGTLAANYSCPTVRDGRAPCAAGALYGFSADIVRWIVHNAGPTEGYEDMEACLWARRFEKEGRSAGRRLDPRGLLEALTGQIGGAWAHPVKDPAHFERCYRDRVSGCTALMFPNSDFPALLYFQLPPRTVSS